MRPEAALGEESVQSPFVFKDGGVYHLFYGDWNHICRATSSDGKTFTRVVGPDGKTGMFGEGIGNFTRDPMVLRIGGIYYCYYTANPEGGKGAVALQAALDDGVLPDLKALIERFRPKSMALPVVIVTLPSLAIYDQIAATVGEAA